MESIGKFEFLEKLSKSSQKIWNTDPDELIPKSMRVYGTRNRLLEIFGLIFFKIPKN